MSSTAPSNQCRTEAPAIRQAFIPIGQLKPLIQKRQALGLGWPTCVLRVKTASEYRPDVSGTLSLFANQSGQSQVHVGKRQVLLDDQHFLITNAGQEYSLGIENQPTETFNIHFGAALMQESREALFSSAEQLLDQHHSSSQSLQFFNRVYPKPHSLKQSMQAIWDAQKQEHDSSLALESALQELLVLLLGHHREAARLMARTPALRTATRQELFDRLGQARDFIHSHPGNALHLDDLAAAAALSKYHFLRLFKAVYNLTPHQYIARIRLQKAMHLLKSSNLPVAQIALETGFENTSSFSRFFNRQLALSPNAFRAVSR